MRKLLIAATLFASLCSTATATQRRMPFRCWRNGPRRSPTPMLIGIVKLYASDALAWAPVARQSSSSPRGFGSISRRRSSVTGREAPNSTATRRWWCPIPRSLSLVWIPLLVYAMGRPIVRMGASHSSSRNVAPSGKSCISIGRQCRNEVGDTMQANHRFQGDAPKGPRAPEPERYTQMR